MTTRDSICLLGFGIVVVGICSPLLQGVRWVGRTNLEVHFLVVDRETNQPISEAKIHVRARPGGFCRNRDAREFTIVTDAQGNAKQMCEECMCFGTRSTFENTYGVHLPWWTFHVVASDYIATQPTDLEEFAGTVHKVQRGDSFAVVSLPIRLQKNASMEE